MASKFETFAALHVPGDPVILYNIWDVGSAHAIVSAGAKALATGSHPVADANGWPDGQQVPIDFALPLNVIAFPGAPDKSVWASAGVARISHGPFPHRALMKQLEDMARAAIS